MWIVYNSLSQTRGTVLQWKSQKNLTDIYFYPPRARQATLGNQGPLDLLVHPVLAVVEVLLPLEVVKSLLGFHPTMEMNHWISRSTPRRLCRHSSLLMDK